MNYFIFFCRSTAHVQRQSPGPAPNMGPPQNVGPPSMGPPPMPPPRSLESTWRAPSEGPSPAMAPPSSSTYDPNISQGSSSPPRFVKYN